MSNTDMINVPREKPELLPALVKAARLNDLCRTYSIKNPTRPLNKNPFFEEGERAHKEATGDKFDFWVCGSCWHVMPPLSEQGKTGCCNADVLLEVR